MSALVSRLLSALRGEQDVRRGTELDAHFAGAHRQVFAGAQIKRHAGPAPVVNEQFQRDVGFDVGIRFHLRSPAGSRARGWPFDGAGEVLAAHDLSGHVLGRQRADGFEQLHLFVADGFGFERHRRFHGDERQHLEHVVLHHVAQRAGLLVITAALADAEFFADGDLHVVHGVAVPELLENRIGKAEHQNVLHRFLAEIMVNAADLLFVGVAGQFARSARARRRGRGRTVSRRRCAASRRLPCAAAPARCSCSMTCAELARLRGEIKQQVFPQRRAAERGQHFFQLFVGRGVGEVALAIKQVCGEFLPDRFVHRFGAGKLVERRAQFRAATIRRSFRAAQSR